MRTLSPLQTTGSAWINVNGLNKEDRDRIKQIGFNAWLDEVTGQTKNTKTNQQINIQIQKKAFELEKKEQVIRYENSIKLKPGSIGYILAVEFFKLARANNGYVTYEQTAKLCPKYPNDPALWARQAGAEVITERKNKRFKVVMYV